MRAVEALRGILTRRADPRVAALCRIGVGAAAALDIATTAQKVVSFFTEREWVPAPNFTWLPDPGPDGALALVVIGLVSAVAFCVGFATRTSGILMVGALVYRIIVDQNLYSNHAYLLTLITCLLVLADSGAAFSLDRRWGKKHASDIPDWPLTLIRIQVSLMYLFTGVAKVNRIFLSGTILRALTALPVFLPYGPAIVAISWLVVAWEIFQAGALWSRRLRGFAFLSGILFHTAIVVLMGRFQAAALISFGMATVSCYLLFTDVARGSSQTQDRRDWLSRKLTAVLHRLEPSKTK